MNMLLFVVSAIAAGVDPGPALPPGTVGLSGRGLLDGIFSKLGREPAADAGPLFPHRAPATEGGGDALDAQDGGQGLAAVSTVLLGGALLLFLDSKVTAGLVVLWWVLLWFYCYTVLEQLKRLIKAFERAELFRILSLFLTLVFNTVAFSIAFGVRGGLIAGYLLVFIVELAVAFVVVGVAAFFFGHDTPQAT